MRLKIKGALFRCGRCRKTYSSPFGHVCTARTDFAKRKAAAAKAARKAGKPAHRYEACRDGGCQRLACRAFTEGRAEGHREGYQDGDRDGYRRGFGDGLAAGAGDRP